MNYELGQIVYWMNGHEYKGTVKGFTGADNTHAIVNHVYLLAQGKNGVIWKKDGALEDEAYPSTSQLRAQF